MYLCASNIAFASIYDFSIGFLELFRQCGLYIFDINVDYVDQKIFLNKYSSLKPQSQLTQLG